MNVDAEKIGRHIKAARNVAGFKMVEASEMLGVSVKSLWEYETGHTLPRLDRLLKMSELYGVGLERLIGM